MDAESVFETALTAFAMVRLGHPSSEITAEVQGFMQGPVTIRWDRCLKILVDMLELHDHQSGTFELGRQLIEIPYRFAQSNSLQPLIIFHDCALSETEKEPLVSTTYSWCCAC